MQHKYKEDRDSLEVRTSRVNAGIQGEIRLGPQLAQERNLLPRPRQLINFRPSRLTSS